MSVELNPCRCGGRAILDTVYNTGGNVRFVRCCQCSACGPWGSSPENAAAKWAEFCPMAQPEPVTTDAAKVLRKILDLPDDDMRGVTVRLPFWLEYEATVAAGRTTTGEPKPGPIGHVTVSPLVAAVETARASARNAELDLRKALAAADGIAWFALYDQVEPATKLANRLESIAQRLLEGGGQ